MTPVQKLVCVTIDNKGKKFTAFKRFTDRDLNEQPKGMVIWSE